MLIECPVLRHCSSTSSSASIVSNVVCNRRIKMKQTFSAEHATYLLRGVEIGNLHPQDLLHAPKVHGHHIRHLNRRRRSDHASLQYRAFLRDEVHSFAERPAGWRGNYDTLAPHLCLRRRVQGTDVRLGDVPNVNVVRHRREAAVREKISVHVQVRGDGAQVGGGKGKMRREGPVKERRVHLERVIVLVGSILFKTKKNVRVVTSTCGCLSAQSQRAISANFLDAA